MISRFLNRVQRLYLTYPIYVKHVDYYGKECAIPEDESLIDEPYSKDEAMRMVRLRRNELLVATDWTQMPDVNIDDLTRQRYREYRQALRDYPQLINIDEWTAPAWPTLILDILPEVTPEVTPENI